LQTEYNKLIGEIDRQASNIGLNNTGKYRIQMAVYIGGGSAQAQAKVQFDLSAAQVDSAGLDISTTMVSGSANELLTTGGTFAGSADLTGSTKFLIGDSQSFAFSGIGTANKSVTATINGGTDGLTGAQVLESLNAQLNPYGISASTDGTGKLRFVGSGDFSLGIVTAGAGSGPDIVTSTAAENSAVVGGASDTANSLAALTAIEDAVKRLGTVQGTVGTAQNQLSYAINLAQSQISSFSAAESRIRDADVASEAANLTKAQVLQQASLAAMAQANSAPQAVMALLRG
jgi:flagellin-like hook-associated protein FlgL